MLQESYLWSFTGPIPVCLCLSYHRVQDWTQHSRCGHTTLSREEGSPPTTYWKCFSKCSLGCCWPILLQRHIAISVPIYCPPWPPGHHFPSTSLSACSGAWGVPSLVQDFSFPLDELHEILVCPCLQPAEVPLNRSTTTWSVNHSSQFCIIYLILI